MRVTDWKKRKVNECEGTAGKIINEEKSKVWQLRWQEGRLIIMVMRSLFSWKENNNDFLFSPFEYSQLQIHTYTLNFNIKLQSKELECESEFEAVWDESRKRNNESLSIEIRSI